MEYKRNSRNISSFLSRLYLKMKRYDEARISSNSNSKRKSNNSNIENIHSMKFRMKKAGPALSSILKVSISIFPWRKAIIDKPCITNQ